MNKFLPVILALVLSACSAYKVKPAAAPSPLTLELMRHTMVQGLVCSDDLDCLKKLTGLCHNGYSATKTLHGENSKVVGILYHCITDQEKLHENDDD